MSCDVVLRDPVAQSAPEEQAETAELPKKNWPTGNLVQSRNAFRFMFMLAVVDLGDWLKGVYVYVYYASIRQ